MSKIIVVANQKGGVAKTSTVRNLSYSLAELGKKVLTVDLDPQSNLTIGFGIIPKKAKHTTGTLITRMLTEEELPEKSEYIQTVGKVDILPASRALTVAEVNMLITPGSNKYLSKLLEPLRDDYDYILIDTNPSLGALTINALTACDEVLIPIDPELFAITGLNDLMDSIGKVKANLNPAILILPIIMICVCLIMGGGVLLYMKLSKKNGTNKKSQETDPAAVTANEFVNVRDISGKFLYTRDNMVLAYLRIMPISIDLFSKSEKQQIVRQLTANLSSADYPFQLIAVSRPVDISPLLSELSDTLTACGDGKQKELLKQEMVEMSSFALSGDVVERQFYLKIWDKAHENTERELLQKLKYLEGYFSDVGVRSEILEQQDIIRLCNLINNPSYVHLEDSDAEPAIPMIVGYANG